MNAAHYTFDCFGASGRVIASSGASWSSPRHWEAEAKEAGERRRVLVPGVFELAVLREDELHERLFAVADDTPHLDWLFLTRSPEFIEVMLAGIGDPRQPDQDLRTQQRHKPRANWWFGVPIETQAEADQRIDILKTIPTPVRFLFAAPPREFIDLSRWIGRETWPTHPLIACDEWKETGEAKACCGCPCGGRECPGEWDRGLHWVITGGESGPNANPLHPDWVRLLRDQCHWAGIPFWFQGYGAYEPAPWTLLGRPEDMSQYRTMTQDGRFVDHTDASGTLMVRTCRYPSNPILDGRTWAEIPKTHQ
jgi:protein gp37